MQTTTGFAILVTRMAPPTAFTIPSFLSIAGSGCSTLVGELHLALAQRVRDLLHQQSPERLALDRVGAAARCARSLRVVALDWARIGAQEIHFDPTFMHGAVWLTLMEQHRKLV